MSHSYPESFFVEIDRDALCKYYRLKSLLAEAIFPIYFGIMGGGISISKEKQRDFECAADAWIAFLRGLGLGVLGGLLVGVICYYLFAHFSSRKWANNLSVRVEGPFLRVIEGAYFVRDRRLHFKAITDYSTSIGPLLRFCGIGQIILNTTAGGSSSTIRIPGVKNALEVRDMLSEIDRLRQDG